MRLPQSIGWDVIHLAQAHRAEGIEQSTADAGEQWSTCETCGSGTHWLSTTGECAVCALDSWDEWDRREGMTGDIIADACGLTWPDHRRIIRAATAVYFAACRESFPRQLCANCGRPAGYAEPDGWHHLDPTDGADCWAPWMAP